MPPIDKTRQAGFTLIEALVAIVVISLGLLGLLGLQTFSITATQGSQFRSVASIGAQDIAGRIQANPAGAHAGYYAPVDNPERPATLCQGSSVNCSPEQMARYDAWRWQQSLANALPQGRGFVDCAQTSTIGGSHCSLYRVTIAWRERDTTDNRPAADLLCRDTDHDIDGACLVSEVGP